MNQEPMDDLNIPPLTLDDVFNFNPITRVEPSESISVTSTQPLNTIDYNIEQLDAIHTINGPLLIIAGAGSGKTRTLMGRIDYMIEQGISPTNILAITFTNKAANEMKERLSIQARSVTASTIHSFCANLLRRYAHTIGFKPGFTIYDTDDVKQLIRYVKEDVAEKEMARIRELNPYTSETTITAAGTVIRSIKDATIASKISKAKSEGLTPHDVANSDEDYAQIIAVIYQNYEKAKIADNAMDFDDLLLYMRQMLQTQPLVRDRVRAQYHYIMVDEYQDTNVIQNDIVNLIVSDNQDLCVVGDPDQSIYAFRGAKIKNIINFNKVYPLAKVVELNKNYRSTQDILNVANDIINHNQRVNGQARHLVSDTASNKHGLPTVLKAENGFEEAAFVVEDIKEYLKDGGKPSDIAILYRNNATSRAYDNALRNNGIPFKIVGGLSFYQRREIKDLIAYLTVLANPAASIAVKRIINVPTRGIGLATLQKLEAAANAVVPATSIVDIAVNYLDQLSNLTATQKAHIRSFTDVFTSLDIYSTTMSMKELVEHILTQTRYIDYLIELGDNEEERVENAREFLTDAKLFDDEFREQHPTPLPLVDRVQIFLQKIMLLSSSERDTEETTDYVTLMSLHASKGLEFPVVYMVQVAEGFLPSGMAIKANDIPEERRLMYVGVTRAEKKLMISYAKEYIHYGRKQDTIASRFIDEIHKNHIQEINKTKPKAKFERNTNFTW